MTTLTAVLKSPDFPCDSLQISRVEGREAISQLFSFTIDVVCIEPDDFTFELLGLRASLVFEDDGQEVRTIYGIIARADEIFTTKQGNYTTAYRLVLVPAIWRLTLTDLQQVYLNTSIPDIVRNKLTVNAQTDFQMRLTASYEPKPMVIQFHETDTSFINRLTEHHGISYYFINSEGVEKVIFTDSSSGFSVVDGHETVTINTDGQRFGVYELEFTKTAIPKTWKVQDYNHHTPLLNVVGTYNEKLGLLGKVVDFGPYVRTPLEGHALAQMRAEARVAESHYYAGASDQCWFRAGALVKFQGNQRVPESTPLLIVEVQHHLIQATATDQPDYDVKPEYRNTFRAVNGHTNYRPPLVTPKPKIAGVLTATVEPLQALEVGVTTQVPTIDNNGEYTIRFHFDPAPLYPAPGSRMKSSLPVRMMQGLAGPDYGIHFPLRGGVEVFVLFIEGDPDRPLIAAAVHNAAVPNHIRAGNSLHNKIQTQSGLCFTLKDLPTP
jgi:type VI secretion system secreted protein VgrG